MKSVFGDTTIRVLAFAALLLGFVLVFVAIRVLLVPFVAALFVVYLFDPAIIVLRRRGIDPSNAFLVVLFVTLVAIGGALALMPSGLRLESLVESRDKFTGQFITQLNAVEQWANSKFPIFGSVRLVSEINNKVATIAIRFFDELPRWITSFAVNLLLVPFIAYFMIRDGKTLKRRLIELVPNRYFEMSLIMFNRIDGQIGGYLRGRLIECILVGATQALLMGVATLFVPQRHILLIAVISGVTNIIPYVGPVLGTVFGAVVYLGSGLPMSSMYGLLAAAAAAHIIDNVLIAPTVLSQNVDLHPLTVALVLIVGGELLGALGLLIAIPVASSIKVVAQEFYANYQLQVRT
jgi:predicted PurR-regulated permease PerM